MNFDEFVERFENKKIAREILEKYKIDKVFSATKLSDLLLIFHKERKNDNYVRAAIKEVLRNEAKEIAEYITLTDLTYLAASIIGVGYNRCAALIKEMINNNELQYEKKGNGYYIKTG